MCISMYVHIDALMNSEGDYKLFYVIRITKFIGLCNLGTSAADIFSIYG